MDQPVMTEEKVKGGMKEVCVPASSLAVEGTNPENGDDVEFFVSGKVSRIEGDNAYIELKSVNGQEVSKQSEPESEEDSLRKGAEAMDKENY